MESDLTHGKASDETLSPANVHVQADNDMGTGTVLTVSPEAVH